MRVVFLYLTVMGAVILYSYYLISLVFDHYEKAGRRHIRFQELASSILGTYSNIVIMMLKELLMTSSY
ncbi:hypothetical protein ACS0TY_027135 [Phlomoides rotata]